MSILGKVSRQYSRVTSGVRLILGTPTPSRSGLLGEFLHIETKRFLCRATGMRLSQERFFNYQVSFPDYIAFSDLFRDIFVLQEYAFDGPDDAVIIDCGANIGMSILFFKWTHPSSTILAFEPDAQAHEYLARNVEMNGLQGIELNKAAVFDRDGEISFYSAVHEDASSLLEMSVFPSSLGDRQVKSTTVTCARLSRFLDWPVDLLKLDIQGSETKVVSELAEAGKLSEVRSLIIEYHYDALNNPLGQLISILEGSFYYVSIHAFDQVRPPPYYWHRGHPYTLVIYASRIPESQMHAWQPD